MANEFNFKYMPLEGRLPGRDFEQQTEDVINDLGRRIVTIESESSEASDLAQQAYDKAVSAEETADSARTAAANAQTTAEDAVKQAENANAAAQAAQETASSALTASTEATAAAENANTTANEAQGTANEALEAAKEASATAEDAQTTASTAQSLANEAMQVAQSVTQYECLGFDEGETDDLNDYLEFARLHTSETVLNIPLEGTEFFVDVDVNSQDNKVRQTATTVDGSTTYIRWGTITEDEETEEETVTWSAWSQSTGGGSSLTEIIGLTPNYYKRASLFGTSATGVTVYANTQVNIGNKGYISQVDTVLSLDDVATAANRAGKDVYIYAVQGSGTEPSFVLSMNSTVPDGYTADNSRKIGGFHCECAAVGTISGHPYSGLAAGDIIDISAWDLLHRATSENEGMVYIEGLGKWYDIYLTSYDGSQLASEYGATIVSGYSTEPFHGDKFEEYAGLIGKSLVSRKEFIVFAKGSNEGTNISGSASGVTAGGHSDTAGRRMISNYALEECCGHFWQWTIDLSFATNRNYTSDVTALQAAQNSHCNTGNWYASGYDFDDPSGYTGNNNSGTSNNGACSRLYDPDIDGDNTGKFGDCAGCIQRALVGGYWGDGSSCGSRSANLNNLSAHRGSNCGARLASEPRAVAL